MLEGFDKSWIYTDYSMRYATYTNLDPGNYVFKVKASNNDGIWNETGTSVLITVLPPWYKSLWFRILSVIFILTVIFAIYFMRISFYQRQKTLLTKLVKEKTHSLEETTAALEEKQEEIYLQTEELMSQKEALEQTNQVLVIQKEQITEQNKELDAHRNKLENLVEERTSELVTAKMKAEESDRLKSAFLANMSHEIRTPMNAVVGFASLLKDNELSDFEKDKMIDIIIQNSDSLLALINEILDLSKIEANQVTLNIVSFDIVALLNEIRDNFELIAKKKNIQLILKNNLFYDKLMFNSDFNRIRQVITNLVDNAVKFTESGNVKFGIHEVDNSKITFFVKDTGIGIDPKIGMSVFGRFIKTEYKNQVYPGTGLGLPICKSIVALWNGEIWFESILNEGTTFYFTHPVNFSNQAKIPETESKILNKIDNEKIILIAEDQETNYLLLKNYLKKLKVQIVWVQNGFDAVKYAINNHVDLILMDIKMPGMNGLEATTQIKAIKPELPIIAQTAYAFESEMLKFSVHGLDDYLIKPLKAKELYEVLNKYL